MGGGSSKNSGRSKYECEEQKKKPAPARGRHHEKQSKKQGKKLDNTHDNVKGAHRDSDDEGDPKNTSLPPSEMLDILLDKAIDLVHRAPHTAFSIRSRMIAKELQRCIALENHHNAAKIAHTHNPHIRSQGCQTEVVLVSSKQPDGAEPEQELELIMQTNEVDDAESDVSSFDSSAVSTVSHSLSSSICAMTSGSAAFEAEKEVMKCLRPKRNRAEVHRHSSVSDQSQHSSHSQARFSPMNGDRRKVDYFSVTPDASPAALTQLDLIFRFIHDFVTVSIFDQSEAAKRGVVWIQKFADAECVTLWDFEKQVVHRSIEEGLPIPLPSFQQQNREESSSATACHAKRERVVVATTVYHPLPCGCGVLSVAAAKRGLDRSVCDVFAEACSHLTRLRRLYEKAVFQQKKSTAMLSLADHLCQCSLEASVPLQIMKVAQELCGAVGCVLYVIRPNRREISAHFQADQFQSTTVQLPFDSGIVYDIAQSREGAVLRDPHSDPKFDSSLDQLTGFYTTAFMCLPVLVEGEVQAMACLLNKEGGSRNKPKYFERSDMEMLDSFTMFVGVALRNSHYYKQMLREKETTDMVLSIVKKVSESDIRDIDSVSHSVIQGAKKLCRADRCALFLKDEEKGQIVAKLPDGGEIRIPVGAGIAGAVGKFGTKVNIPQAYEDTRFNQAIDKKTGYTTQSILCYPIHCNSEVIAVAQLINKIDDIGRVVEFDVKDEALLQSFAEFAGITIGNARLYGFVVQAGDDAMRLYNLQMNGEAPEAKTHAKKVNFASDDDVEKLKNVVMDTEGLSLLDTWDFPVHKYDATPEDLMVFVVEIFRRLNLTEQFQIPERTLYTFLATLIKMYRPIPYHCISHAFDVMQTLYVFLGFEDVRSKLVDVDILCLLLIGLLHDVDHMGLNNSFHLKAETPLGILISASGSQSVLEVHHCTIAIEMLQDSRTNILANVSEDGVKHIYKMLTSAILGTDMTRHGAVASEFDSVCPAYCIQVLDHRIKLVTALTIVADVSNAYKPFGIARMWGAKITAEFNTQGEAERKEDLPQTFKEELTLFQQQVSFCKGQIGFVTMMVLPLLQVLARHMPSFSRAIAQIVCLF